MRTAAAIASREASGSTYSRTTHHSISVEEGTESLLFLYLAAHASHLRLTQREARHMRTESLMRSTLALSFRQRSARIDLELEAREESSASLLGMDLGVDRGVKGVSG